MTFTYKTTHYIRYDFARNSQVRPQNFDVIFSANISLSDGSQVEEIFASGSNVLFQALPLLYS